MNEEMETILRRSLDEVDRTRKRAWVLLILFFCGLLLFLYSVGMTGKGAGDPKVFIQVFQAVFVLMLTDVFVVLALGLFITHMTKKILKAIDLLSKG